MGWLFDTAASWHITSDQSAFITYIDLNHFSDTEMPDDCVWPVKDVGTIYLPVSKRSIEFWNIYYIPQIQANLISTS